MMRNLIGFEAQTPNLIDRALIVLLVNGVGESAPSSKPKMRRNLAGVTKVPRLPIRLDSETAIMTSCCRKIGESVIPSQGPPGEDP
jgi:hypothetical protein